MDVTEVNNNQFYTKIEQLSINLYKRGTYES